jgi:hypothetical protein
MRVMDVALFDRHCGRLGVKCGAAVKFYDPALSLFLLRTPREHASEVWASLTFITSIAGLPVTISVVHSAGRRCPNTRSTFRLANDRENDREQAAAGHAGVRCYLSYEILLRRGSTLRDITTWFSSWTFDKPELLWCCDGYACASDRCNTNLINVKACDCSFLDSVTSRVNMEWALPCPFA